MMKRILFVMAASLVISSSIPTGAAAASSEASLVSTAKDYLGTKYKYAGTSRSGIDCSGYTQLVFKDEGISIPRSTKDQWAMGKSIAKKDLQVGDLVFFITVGNSVSHVGIYIGNNNFIHASTSKGVTVTSLDEPYYWKNKYLGAKRIANFKTETVKTVASHSKADPLPTRTDIAVTLVNELNLKAESTQSVFKDIPNNHTQIAAISAVYEAGIFTGSNGSFKPESHLSRAHLAKVLVEAFNLEGQADISFKDVPANHWAYEYISILYYNGITTGYENGKFGVEDYVTAVQFDKFVERIHQN